MMPSLNPRSFPTVDRLAKILCSDTEPCDWIEAYGDDIIVSPPSSGAFFISDRTAKSWIDAVNTGHDDPSIEALRQWAPLITDDRQALDVFVDLGIHITHQDGQFVLSARERALLDAGAELWEVYEYNGPYLGLYEGSSPDEAIANALADATWNALDADPAEFYAEPSRAREARSPNPPVPLRPLPDSVSRPVAELKDAAPVFFAKLRNAAVNSVGYIECDGVSRSSILADVKRIEKLVSSVIGDIDDYIACMRSTP